MTSVKLNELLKGPTSKYSHTLGLQRINWGRWTIQSVTQACLWKMEFSGGRKKHASKLEFKRKMHLKLMVPTRTGRSCVCHSCASTDGKTTQWSRKNLGFGVRLGPCWNPSFASRQPLLLDSDWISVNLGSAVFGVLGACCREAKN